MTAKHIEALERIEELEKNNKELLERLERKNSYLSTITKAKDKLAAQVTLANGKQKETEESFKVKIKELKDKHFAEKQEIWKEVVAAKEALKVRIQHHIAIIKYLFFTILKVMTEKHT